MYGARERFGASYGSLSQRLKRSVPATMEYKHPPKLAPQLQFCKSSPQSLNLGLHAHTHRLTVLGRVGA